MRTGREVGHAARRRWTVIAWAAQREMARRALKTDTGPAAQHLEDLADRSKRWLISESPLVDGPHVVVSPGGPSAGMVVSWTR
jgi:hypothetical protein